MSGSVLWKVMRDPKGPELISLCAWPKVIGAPVEVSEKRGCERMYGNPNQACTNQDL